MSELFNPQEPVFWVLISFILFMALLAYLNVPAMIGKALDARADGIRKELDEARKLREEAQALLASYQRKANDAESEAKAIVEQARKEAEALAADAKKSLAESIDRRSKMAEEKIARAETQAVSEVRATAVESALAAAQSILKSRVTGGMSDGLIDQATRDLKGKLN